MSWMTSGSPERCRQDTDFDLDVFSPEREQQALVAGDAGDATVETMGSSQVSAVGASSTPVGKVQTAETIGPS